MINGIDNPIRALPPQGAINIPRPPASVLEMEKQNLKNNPVPIIITGSISDSYRTESDMSVIARMLFAEDHRSLGSTFMDT
jgi:hypothetical protein